MTTLIDEEEEFESTNGDATPLVPNTDRRYAGVRALWMKVIIRAVFDWVTYRDNTKLDKRKYAESAHEWIFKKSLLFNSFDNICRYLDIDPDRIRLQAQKMTKDDVAKIEHMERDYESEELEELIEEDEKPVLKPASMAYPRLAAEVVSDEVF